MKYLAHLKHLSHVGAVGGTEGNWLFISGQILIPSYCYDIKPALLHKLITYTSGIHVYHWPRLLALEFWNVAYSKHSKHRLLIYPVHPLGIIKFYTALYCFV